MFKGKMVKVLIGLDTNIQYILTEQLSYRGVSRFQMPTKLSCHLGPEFQGYLYSYQFRIRLGGLKIKTLNAKLSIFSFKIIHLFHCAIF